MDKATFEALEEIIDYLYLEEKKSFEESEPEDRKNHIFNQIEKVAKHLIEIQKDYE